MISRKGRSVVASVAAMALVVALASTAVATQFAAKIVGFAFAPSTVTIHVGDSIEWVNGDSVGHTVTADDASFDTGTIAGGTKASLTFDTVGTFPYHCSIHSSMHGTVVVEAAAAPPPPTDAAPTTDGGSAGPGWLLLGVAAALGLELGRRRFASRQR
jgi:plastocyanin